MRIARWITKPTNTHSQYVITTGFQLQQWLYNVTLFVICTGRYLHNTQQIQQKNICALSGIRTYDLSTRAPSNQRLTPHGQRDCLLCDYRLSNEVAKNCDLPKHRAAISGNFLATFPYNLSVPSSGVKNLS
jgi:hypothetical protein